MKITPIFCLVFAASLAGTFAQAPLYSVLDLGTLGGVYSYATGVNDLGQVTGTSLTSTGASHAFLYSNGIMQDLGTLNNGQGLASNGFSVNNAGQVVGWGYGGQGGSSAFAFLYTNGNMQVLPGLPPSAAYAINSSGQITGQTNFGMTQGFLYYGGSSHSLGDLGNINAISSGYALNDLGQVTGYALTATNQIHAFLSFNGAMTDLGTVGDSYDRSLGYGINNLGQITGVSSSSTGAPDHAFFYSGTMHDIGTLDGATTSLGIGINDAGFIVGNALMSTGLDHGFLYLDGHMFDLNDLISPSADVTDIALNFQGDPINELGQIAAYGTVDGQKHALLLTLLSVPEPSTFAFLLVAGLIGFGLRLRLYPRNSSATPN